MENGPKFIIASGGFATVILASFIIGNAIQHQDLPEPIPFGEVGRYTVQQTFSDGWQIFDSAKGRLCVIPNVSNRNSNVECSDVPKNN